MVDSFTQNLLRKTDLILGKITYTVTSTFMAPYCIVHSSGFDQCLGDSLGIRSSMFTAVKEASCSTKQECRVLLHVLEWLINNTYKNLLLIFNSYYQNIAFIHCNYQVVLA